MMNKIKFDEKGLIPAIIQDINTKDILMMAYMNKDSLLKTLETKQTWFYSRSRQELWNKGATSGNVQNVKKISYDCDGDTLLIEVEQTGVACHTGKYSCFFNELYKTDDYKINFSLDILYNVIEDRKNNPKEGSYTNYLFDKGLDKILKKVGEENAEVIIASKNEDISELKYEIADLVYHTLVLMIEKGIKIQDIKEELSKRVK
ncbi:phosphoribosyl-ATP pyrophosphatase /phosphoribosyl-AMP cyclohydrolase [Hypnocyclicus thermotrophus]|uniref:Histidine biosynthesis bifunctional protein HisIE n=1 Tax=Hypnocyclicus thermotrophus TaxID=1627895 RepID=A0AA46DZ42_9FUSO|nr:bifunctional phosphoribosyl-AMP cyclohydrolase/phosphoribosyl-ATP diphosphatase HisIE [Hypnocyclicus thermotrophus]TDT71465.1 phosphoribosyl-ATP pyrophosphatase /phosphoribosyl-AMP cyclohydrolase [Hypnocyclicus thermotrophus]